MARRGDHSDYAELARRSVPPDELERGIESARGKVCKKTIEGCWKGLNDACENEIADCLFSDATGNEESRASRREQMKLRRGAFAETRVCLRLECEHGEANDGSCNAM